MSLGERGWSQQYKEPILVGVPFGMHRHETLEVVNVVVVPSGEGIFNAVCAVGWRCIFAL